jgi:hypothetical protein
MYLTKPDYLSRIETNLFDLLLGTDETAILAAASKEVEDTILAYLGNLYDIAGELAKTGTDRNGYIMSIALRIALFNIITRADADRISDKTNKDYEMAMRELQRIADGKHQLNLPPKPPPAPPSPPTVPDGLNAGLGWDETVNPGAAQTAPLTGLRRMGTATPRTHVV